ncbi:hypothetical protein B0H34DRAFT_697008 [Crassisporium funariophilum]|nr:hypothetical protein B0H34DRAFT_697008 [Crassisporium funariophilum]
MFILLALGLHVLQYGHDILAAPLATAIEDAREAVATLPSQETTSQRSHFDMIWSCLVTLFACTWISMHPNIPGSDDSPITIVRRRVKIMLYALIVPEGVMYWAMRQWLGSRKIANKYREEGWTKVHGHFLQMGGFMMHEPNKEPYTLSPEHMETLLERNEITLPSITEDEINDRSKGDILAKGIVVVQTLWFVMQCIARGAQGLTITEIELVTLAFAAFNGITYYFWWNKPLDVRCPVYVYLKNPKSKVKKTKKKQKKVEIPKPRSPKPKEGLWQRLLDVLNDLLDLVYFDIRDEIKERGLRHAIKRRSLLIVHPLLNVRDTFHRVWLFSRRLLVIFRPLVWARETLHQMTESDDSTAVKVNAQRVPTFYALKMDIQSEYMLDCTMSFFAMVFGAIHCVAWVFQFPSAVEQTLWRVSSLAIVLAPGFVLFLAFIRVIFLFSWLSIYLFILVNMLDQDKILLVVNVIGLAIYIPARLTIIVLALLSLRSLSPDAFSQVDWTTFVPHF